MKLMLLVLLFSSALRAASFDCSKARTPLEKAICSDPHLSILNEQLNQVYQDALRKAGEADVVVRSEQRIWLENLQQQCSGEQIASCIAQQETARTETLKRTAPPNPAQITEYKLTRASKYFDFILRLFAKPTDSGDDSREGPGHVLIFRKGETTPLQTIATNNIFVSLDKNGQPLVNSAKLYDYQGAINVGDFNFDGHEDFGVQNGNHGSYGGPSYDIYLYSPRTNLFEMNKPFADLIAGSLGFFQVDPLKKTLTTLSKDGCCYHVTTVYSVISNRPVPLSREIEDATQSDTYELVTDEQMKNGKWTKVSTKRLPLQKNQ